MAFNNMDPVGADWPGFIVFSSMIRSSLKCNCIYSADMISKHTFHSKIFEMLRVILYTLLLF